MEFTKVNIRTITEETPNPEAAILELETDTESTFSIISDVFDSQYNLVRINSVTGNAFLTDLGVVFVNTNPRTTIKIKIRANEKGTTEYIERDIIFTIIKIYDDFPNIINNIKYPLYNKDIKTNARIQEIRTEYPSRYTVYSGAQFVQIDSLSGRVSITGYGATWVKDAANLNSDFKYVIKIEDTTNNKHILLEVISQIIDGSTETRTLTANQNELIADIIAKELAKNTTSSMSKIFRNTKIIDSLIKDNMVIEKKIGFADGAIKAIKPELNSKYIIALTDSMNKKFKLLQDTLTNSINGTKELSTNLLKIMADKDKHNAREFNILNEYVAGGISKAETAYNNSEAVLVSLRKVTTEELNTAKNELISSLNELDSRIKEELSSLNTSFQSFVSDVFTPTISQLTSGVTANETKNISQQKTINSHSTSINRINSDMSTLKASITSMGSKTLDNINGGSWDFSGNGLYYNGRAVLTSSGGIGNLTQSGSTFGNSSITFIAKEFKGVATSAKYADLAEIYTSEFRIEPGSVVQFSEHEFEVEIADGSTEPIGIVSTACGFLLNSETDGVEIALCGRVPVKSTYLAKRGYYVYQDEDNPSQVMLSPTKLNKYLLGRCIKQISDGMIEIKV